MLRWKGFAICGGLVVVSAEASAMAATAGPTMTDRYRDVTRRLIGAAMTDEEAGTGSHLPDDQDRPPPQRLTAAGGGHPLGHHGHAPGGVGEGDAAAGPDLAL